MVRFIKIELNFLDYKNVYFVKRIVKTLGYLYQIKMSTKVCVE